MVRCLIPLGVWTPSFTAVGQKAKIQIRLESLVYWIMLHLFVCNFIVIKMEVVRFGIPRLDPP